MQDIWDFHRWLAGRVRADYPRLDIVALVTGDAPYLAGNYVLDMVLRDRYGAAGARMEKMLALRREWRETDSAAHRLFHVHDAGATIHVGVAEINIHQSQLIHAADNPHHPLATLAHEIGHLLGSYGMTRPAPWPPLYEEAAADLFECAVMAVWGVPGYADQISFRRLRSRFNAAALVVHRDYGFPAMAEEGRALALRYAGMDRNGFSPAALRREIEQIVWDNRDKLQAWHDFAAAAHRGGHIDRHTGPQTLRALAPDHVIAHDLERHAAFDLADATEAPPSWLAQRRAARAAALKAMDGAPLYYVAINADIVTGTWPQRKLAAAPVVR